MIHVINVVEKAHEISTAWSPIDVIQVNDQVLRLALFDGTFCWHRHEKEDELFYVVKGQILIQLKGQPDITLSEGEMAVIPKNVEHCPKSVKPSYVLMFEPLTLQSKGDP
ncbi:MAG: cupin domain-containing protein [Theionarchaea archaeon]|nr:cupin domain-containing protein [Theionarchaea archaeon]